MATSGICADVLRVVIADHTLVVGETVLDELRRVLRRKLGVPPETVEAVEAFLRRQRTVIDRASPLGIAIRGPCDMAVLEQAVAGQATVLVTGDRDLLEIEQQSRSALSRREVCGRISDGDGCHPGSLGYPGTARPSAVDGQAGGVTTPSGDAAGRRGPDWYTPAGANGAPASAHSRIRSRPMTRAMACSSTIETWPDS